MFVNILAGESESKGLGTPNQLSQNELLEKNHRNLLVFMMSSCICSLFEFSS